MAMNSTQLKGIKVDKDRDSIIRRYRDGIEIRILAGEYNVTADTLCRRLKKWGIKIRKGDFKRKVHQKPGHFRRRFSPELQVKMRENTQVNNKHIKHCEFRHKSLDQRLIARILLR